MTHRVFREFTERSEADIAAGQANRDLLASTLPLLGAKWDIHLLTFLTPTALARALWLCEVYRLALNVPGSLVEFGSQWGASLNIWCALRTIFEPWNSSREITAFSQFESGFQSLTHHDGDAAQQGDYAVPAEWPSKLLPLLKSHLAPYNARAIDKVGIVHGDACETFDRWLAERPHAVISHVHFDMDVYTPTKRCLELCLPRMPRGAVLIFDELNCGVFPGETQAVQEVLGLRNLALRKSPFAPYSAYCIVDTASSNSSGRAGDPLL